MNEISTLNGASNRAPRLRVVLSTDHKVSSVALELVRAAAEYQNRVNRSEDTAGLVAEYSARFGIDAHISDSLLAGRLATEIDGDQLFVNTAMLRREPETKATQFASEHDTAIARRAPPCAEERARRMQSVMRMHAAACGAHAQDVAASVNVCELLCDLRHWCDEYMVDLYQALDLSYGRYLTDKHQHRCGGRDLP